MEKHPLGDTGSAFQKKGKMKSESFSSTDQRPASGIPEALADGQPKDVDSLSLYRDKVKPFVKRF